MRRSPFDFLCMTALIIRGLTKTYRSGVQALKGIDLNIEEGIFSRSWVPMAQARPRALRVRSKSGSVSFFDSLR